MSHNDNIPERSARRHRPALWAIGTAIGLALIAFLLFSSMGSDEPEGGDVEVVAPGTDAAAGTAGGSGNDASAGTDAEPGTASAPAGAGSAPAGTSN